MFEFGEATAYAGRDAVMVNVTSPGRDAAYGYLGVVLINVAFSNPNVIRPIQADPQQSHSLAHTRA